MAERDHSARSNSTSHVEIISEWLAKCHPRRSATHFAKRARGANGGTVRSDPHSRGDFVRVNHSSAPYRPAIAPYFDKRACRPDSEILDGAARHHGMACRTGARLR
jgi:hypothetical protein